MREALSHLHTRGLTIGPSMFYKYVGEEEGKIRPHGPRKTKYYSLDELNKFADTQIGHSQSEGDLAFSRATVDDLEGITTVAQKLFKHSHAPFIATETRRSWLLKEPRGHYIIKRPNGEVVAWLHIVALTDEIIKRYMNREIYGRNLTADEVQVYVPGRPQSCILLSIGTDPDLDKKRRDGKRPVGSKCMGMLLHGVSQDLALLGMQGIIIDKVYAWSETREGITMSTKMGMQQYAQPYKAPREPRRYTFFLDVQQSTMPIVRGYQKALREWYRLHGLQQPLGSPTDGTAVIWQPVTPTTRKKATQEPTEATHPPPAEEQLPNGLIGLAAYAKQHGIPETTLKKAVTAGRIPAIHGRWKAGRAIIQIALDEQGQAKAMELYGQRQTLFDD